jgi:hypothetical protein
MYYSTRPYEDDSVPRLRSLNTAIESILLGARQVVKHIDVEPKHYRKITLELKRLLTDLKQSLTDMCEHLRVVMQHGAIPPLTLADLEAALKATKAAMAHLRERARGYVLLVIPTAKPFYNSTVVRQLCSDIETMLQDVQLPAGGLHYRGSGGIQVNSQHQQTLAEDMSTLHERGRLRGQSVTLQVPGAPTIQYYAGAPASPPPLSAHPHALLPPPPPSATPQRSSHLIESMSSELPPCKCGSGSAGYCSNCTRSAYA